MPELLVATLSAASGSGGTGQISLFKTDGALTGVAEHATTKTVPHPSFAAWSARRSKLYVTSEIANGQGRVTAVSVSTAGLTAESHAATGGNAAVHISLDRRENFLFVANYQTQPEAGPLSIAIFSLEADGSVGRLTGHAEHDGHGPDRARQQGPHCHFVSISPDNRLLAAIDLGTDSLHFYRFDAANGTIALAFHLKLPPGSGPRHAVFHPSRPLIYVTGELASSLMSVSFDVHAQTAELLASEPATARDTEVRNYPSGISISPEGHCVLAANRGADTIATFWTDPETGIARLKSETDCGGAFPRAIRFDATGRYLAVANQKSDTVCVFGWDFASGQLSPRPILSWPVPAPLDVAFLQPE
ncbi:lactonase family protein [Rhizobium sp. KVB221]|uniref:Lactonase family protein n=1 Tax=Rhizobium setariae TaxID=2801340 RepID=A0A936YHY0_9HYPH|nr:lactonase family protein [Rhizobium setariae]MBL0370408.1 lactonase family protein [Rhizobium setariae]